jgi:predicted ATPase/DNA-binding XRE family transcriptional regulator
MATHARGTFGERLRRLRDAAGLTQERLAERAGLSANAVAALETGKRRRPHPNTVRALADALGLSAQERGDLEAAVPPLGQPPDDGPLAARTGRLPVSPTVLVGRDEDLEALDRLLSEGARLVTLTGQGGVGKTRLAVEVAQVQAARFADGAAFVDLAPLHDTGLVLPTIAHAVGINEASGETMHETLQAFLRDRRLLLVLDNFEQVMGAALQVSNLLAPCPNVTILATSRAPLRVRGEREYPVRPLATPNVARPIDARYLAENPAVELFVERAKDVSPDFALSHTNAAAVAAICHRLDGVPLALELAAARLRAMSPSDLLRRLDLSLPLLTGGARDLPERQRTMRSVIGWSYQLLAEPEWRLLNRLAVFRGGWDLEAAETVGAGGDILTEEVLDRLMSLVEQSLVVAETGEGGDTRYRLLVPVREYAEERLEHSGEAEQTRLRHAAYYLDLAERAEPELRGAHQVVWHHRLAREHDNVRAALAWLLRHGEAATVVRFGWALWLFWWIRGHTGEGRRVMEGLIGRAETEELPLSSRARLLFVVGTMACGQADYETSGALLERSLVQFRELEDKRGLAYTLGSLSFVAIGQGRYDRGSALLEEATSLFLDIGDAWAASALRNNLAAIPLNLGDYERAALIAGEGLALAREVGDNLNGCASLGILATVALTGGEYERATTLFEEALLLASEMADAGHISACLEGMAAVAGVLGYPERAARLSGAAETVRHSAEITAYVYHAPIRAIHERYLRVAQAQCEGPCWTRAWSDGRAMDSVQAVEYALEFSHERRKVSK